MRATKSITVTFLVYTLSIFSYYFFLSCMPMYYLSRIFISCGLVHLSNRPKWTNQRDVIFLYNYIVHYTHPTLLFAIVLNKIIILCAASDRWKNIEFSKVLEKRFYKRYERCGAPLAGFLACQILAFMRIVEIILYFFSDQIDLHKLVAYLQKNLDVVRHYGNGTPHPEKGTSSTFQQYCKRRDILCFANSTPVSPPPNAEPTDIFLTCGSQAGDWNMMQPGNIHARATGHVSQSQSE